MIRNYDLNFFREYDEFVNNTQKYVIPTKTLICEYLNGDEYSIDTLSNEGRLYYCVVRKRYSTHGGLALEAEVIRNSRLEKVARLLVKKFKLSYINNIQIKENRNGIPKIMEINPRIPGTISLSVAAGYDFISDTIKLVYNKKISKSNKINYGLKIIRYWSGVFIDKQNTKSIVNLKSRSNVATFRSNPLNQNQK